MTDPTPRPDDDLVSAVLDGEATADERALVEADPAARARLAELAAVRDRVAAPVTVPAAARERALAAALDAFDTPVLATTDPAAAAATGPIRPDPGPTDELAGRRARRSGSGGRYLAAAAAIVVVLFGAGVALRVLNPAAERTVASSDAAAPGTSSPAGGTGADSGEVNESTRAGGDLTTTIPVQPTAPATTTAPMPALDQAFPADLVAVDLGSVASPRDLRNQLLGVVDGRAAASNDPAAPNTAQGPPALARAEWTTCASYLDAVDVELDQLLAVATATVDGRPVLAYAFSIDQAAYPAANGSIRIYAVDPANGCETVSVQTTR